MPHTAQTADSASFTAIKVENPRHEELLNTMGMNQHKMTYNPEGSTRYILMECAKLRHP